MNTQQFSTCPLCEAMCGIVVETDGRRLTSVRGDSEDTFSRGHVCPKAVADSCCSRVEDSAFLCRRQLTQELGRVAYPSGRPFEA